MRSILLSVSLVLAVVACVPSASAAATCVLPPVSQFQACVANGCAIVDGPAMHREVCAGPVIGAFEVCTPAVSQFGLCAGLPCSTVDGPAMHREVCVNKLLVLS